jgi:hypothetical protein
VATISPRGDNGRCREAAARRGKKKRTENGKKRGKSPVGCVRDESDSGDACHSSRSEPLRRRETDGGVSAQEGCRPGARSATKHQLDSSIQPEERADGPRGLRAGATHLLSCCNDGRQIHFRRGSSPSKSLLAQFKCKMSLCGWSVRSAASDGHPEVSAVSRSQSVAFSRSRHTKRTSRHKLHDHSTVCWRGISGRALPTDHRLELELGCQPPLP